MEEDIKILEEFIDAVGEEYEVVKEKQALENLIKRYRELEESKITRERVNDIQEETKRIVNETYIPKPKIKEKIEEIDKAIIIAQGEELLIFEAKKDFAQELLEEK